VPRQAVIRMMWMFPNSNDIPVKPNISHNILYMLSPGATVSNKYSVRQLDMLFNQAINRIGVKARHTHMLQISPSVDGPSSSGERIIDEDALPWFFLASVYMYVRQENKRTC
jgi:hypothetical protein